MATPHPNHALRQRVSVLEEKVEQIEKQLVEERELRSRFEQNIIQQIEGRNLENVHVVNTSLQEELEKERKLRISAEEEVQVLKKEQEKERKLRISAQEEVQVLKKEQEKERKLRISAQEEVQVLKKEQEKERKLRISAEEEVQVLKKQLEQQLRITSEENLKKEQDIKTQVERQTQQWKRAFRSVVLGVDLTERLADAAHRGDIEVVKFLLEQNVSPSSILKQPRDERSSVTPLHEAVRCGHADVCRVMSQNVKEYVKSSDIILYAVRKGRADVCEQLINSGADVNAMGINGYTALQCAASNINTQVCRLLISRGADVNAKGINGYTALQCAASDNNTQVCQLLISRGADVNVKNNGGNTALHCAAWAGKLQAVQLLADSKADLSIRSNNGETALQFAQRNKHNAVVQYLKYRMESS